MAKSVTKMKATKKLNNPARACFLVEMAEKVYGIDPLDTIRCRDNTWARAAITIQLVQDGETYQKIGFFLSKDYSSIAYYIKKHPALMKFDTDYKTRYQDFLIEIGKPINQVEVTLQEIKEQVIKVNKQLTNLDYNPDQIQNFWNEVIEEARKN